VRVVAVMDLKGGVVVRGVGGRRAEYRPIESSLTSSCDPLDVAEAFRSRLGLNEIYLADLDAIGGAAPSLDLFKRLQEASFSLWVDAGLRTWTDAAPLVQSRVSRVVAGLENLAGLEELARLCEAYGEQVVFSLDLKGGSPLGGSAGWPDEPSAIAEAAIDRGVRQLLVLDLARVGEGGGTGTEELCGRVARTFPDVEVCAGGGVRGLDDLKRLCRCGVRAALVAASLHDGRLTREDITALMSHGRHS
jgi:phosphoribosylformimino-5-aminoimidazole carboxamide ribotide isomerase